MQHEVQLSLFMCSNVATPPKSPGTDFSGTLFPESLRMNPVVCPKGPKQYTVELQWLEQSTMKYVRDRDSSC